MTTKVLKTLMQLAKELELTHIEGNYYRGKYGMVLKITKFGFVSPSIMEKDYPKGL